MYKVGDEVLIKADITCVHEGTDKPYFVEPDIYSKDWVSEEKIIPADKTYTDGLNDAWELAKKILNMKMDVAVEAFDCTRISDVMEKFTPEEALAKIEAYEKEKEIKVGDVVLDDGDKGIVTRSGNNYVYILWFDGSCGNYEPSKLKKTDLHIDIEGLLRQIGE